MPLFRRYSFAPQLLRRWYWPLAVGLSFLVWVALALTMLPLKGDNGKYESYPYGLLSAFEQSGIDVLFQLRGVLHPESGERGRKEPITIIGIDEAAIRESNVRLQAWPRDWYAQLIDRASQGGANTIGLDLYLSEAGGLSPEAKAADQKLLDSMNNAGNVVIAQKLEAGGTLPIIPLPVFAEAASGVGFVDLPHDSDGFVRTAKLTYTPSSGETQSSFANLITQIYTQQELVSLGEDKIGLGDRVIPLRNDHYLNIDFRARPPAFTYISAKDILCDEFKRVSSPDLKCEQHPQLSDDLFRDRIVLIGATNNDAPDLFFSPYYESGVLAKSLAKLMRHPLENMPAKMPGVEIHANIIATMLFGNYLHRLSYFWRISLVLLVIILIALAVFWLRALWAAMAVLAVALGLLASASWAFNQHAVVAPLVAGEMGIIVLALSGFLLRYAHERAVREEKEAERAQIMDIFSRCVSPEVAGTLWEKREGLALGGERRIVTLIFTDIRGFTSLSESVSSEVVVNWLNEYFSRMHKIVCSYGGHINKFIGDGLMIVFGAPVARGDKLEARAAVACGLEMLAEVERLNEEWKDTDRPHIAIGVGIHTGEATCGVVGAEGRLEYTIIGDTVNLSARLESTTKDKGVPILISGATASLLGIDYETRPLGDVTVKGKSQSTEVFTVAKAERKQIGELAHAG